MTSQHAERDHAECGGSSAHTWSICPGSRILLRQMPKEEAGEAALEGTEGHETLDILLTDFLEWKISGTDPDIRAALLTKDTDLLNDAKAAVAAVWKYGLQASITGKVYGVEEELILDKKLNMWGYVDFWAAYRDLKANRVGYVFDYKTGRIIVKAPKNPQLAFYAVTLREEIRRAGKDLDYVIAAIYQPKNEEKPYDETRFTAKELDAWKKKFLGAAHEIYVKQKPKFRVGEHCKYCRAKPICKKYIDTCEKESELQVASSCLPTPVLEFSDENDIKISRVLLNRDKIERLLKESYAYAIRRAQSGNPIKGIKVVEATQGRRSWLKDEDFVISNLKELGIEEPTEYSLKTLGEIEKGLVKLLGSKEAAKDELSKLTVKGPPTLTITDEEDPRPQIQSDLALLRDN